MLGWFNEAMDKAESPGRVMRIRKAVRDQRKMLRQNDVDDCNKSLLKEIRTALYRCEDEMGEHIPLDSDSDDEEESEMSFVSDEEFEDEIFF